VSGRLTVSRVLPAPPDRVWPAWTTEQGLAGWWWTHLPGTTYEVDARAGGRYRISSPAAGIGVHGEYAIVDEPSCLTATWVWVDDGVDGPVERVTIRFAPHPSGTLLTIDHDGAWTAREPAEAYRQGWSDVIDALVQVLRA
jgi:uncharacterized protein YndB with AHSA1/START domain